MESRKPEAPDAALRLLGLAARAGAVLPGTERVREAARTGTLRFAIVAQDISENSQDKLLPLLEARAIPHAVRFRRAELGAAVGRAPLSAVGTSADSFAHRLRALLDDGGVERGRAG